MADCLKVAYFLILSTVYLNTMLDIFLFLLTSKGVSLADAIFNDEGLDPAPLPQGMGIARHRLAKWVVVH